MSIDVALDRIVMSQRERDLLKIMAPVLQGERTQAEAARLADLSVRQIRRLQRKLEGGSDAALVHGLRGRPSNRRLKPKLRQQVLETYRQRFADFGPTFACEKLAELDLEVSPDTLRPAEIQQGTLDVSAIKDSEVNLVQGKTGVSYKASPSEQYAEIFVNYGVAPFNKSG